VLPNLMTLSRGYMRIRALPFVLALLAAPSVVPGSAGAQHLSPVAVHSRSVIAREHTPDAVDRTANMQIATLASAHDDHPELWGAFIGGVVGGAVGYAYERGACDQVARLCTGKGVAVAGVIIGAALGYSLGRVLGHRDPETASTP
jgi:hypothetical protein